MSDETPQDAERTAPAVPEADPKAEAGSSAEDQHVTEDQSEAPAEEPVADDKPPAKPAIPGMDLELDLVEEGTDPLNGDSEDADPYALSDEPALIAPEDETPVDEGPIAAEIKLAADARY